MKLRTKMMMISLLPVFVLGIGILILAADRIADGIYQEAYGGMQAAALAVRDIFEVGNKGKYHLDENGDLWKGEALNITQSVEIVDHIKETTGMDVTVFWGDTRILTSIENENGERQTQTTAPKAVTQKVLEDGEYYMDRNVEILGREYIVCYAPFFQDGGETGEPVGMVFLGKPRAGVSKIINGVRLQMLIAVLVVLLVTGVVVTRLVGRIMYALSKSMDLLQKISKGDLTVQADAVLLKRADEIGLIGRGIERLRKELLDIVNALHEESALLNLEAKSLKQQSGNILSVMKGLDSSAQEMSESCANQAQDAATVGGNVMDMGEMIGQSNLEIRKMYEISTQIHMVSEQTMEEFFALNEEMNQVNTSIQYLGDQTKLTKESADKISSATELIAAVASQTSLLSLNASIEAARAGELGRGFGVVASEIQKLSVQANEAVEDIRSMTDSLTQNSNHTMLRMEEVKEFITKQKQTIERTGQVFGQVRAGIQESSGYMDILKQKSVEMESVRTEIVAAAQNSAALSEENAATIQEVQAALESAYGEIHVLSEKTGELDALSAQMRGSVGAFQV